jgi:uncharacterized LabA/DUF88 family protein
VTGQPSPTEATERVTFYVDGFNLYHGLKEHSKARAYRWLNLWTFAQGHLSANQTLDRVIYFTSVPPWSQAKAARHERYIAALESAGVEVVRGRFQRDETTCFGSCGELFYRYTEKLTDVLIATALVQDGVEGRYDCAYLVSGDADQAPAVRTLRKMAPRAKVHVLFPPRRHSAELTQVAHACTPLGYRDFKPYQFPDVLNVRGRVIERPTSW